MISATNQAKDGEPECRRETDQNRGLESRQKERPDNTDYEGERQRNERSCIYIRDHHYTGSRLTAAPKAANFFSMAW